MILLLDTCGEVGGVALAEVGSANAYIVGEVVITGKTFAAELVPAVSSLLRGASLTVADLDAVAVVRGPGSFTGMRIGISAAKGLVEAAGIPLIALSRLAVLTRKAAVPGLTIAVFDAGRSEYYAGIYEAGNCLLESVMTRDQLIEHASDRPAVVVVCEPRVEAALAELQPTMLALPTLGDALPIAVERWRARQFEDVMSLDGNYLRRSDAEIFSSRAIRPKLADPRPANEKAGAVEPEA
jgi:tRNA threonylcarbamoyladenosine biosynthesis protein TsaB